MLLAGPYLPSLSLLPRSQLCLQHRVAHGNTPAPTPRAQPQRVRLNAETAAEWRRGAALRAAEIPRPANTRPLEQRVPRSRCAPSLSGAVTAAFAVQQSHSSPERGTNTAAAQPRPRRPRAPRAQGEACQAVKHLPRRRERFSSCQ